jgi:hypothetical protein
MLADGDPRVLTPDFFGRMTRFERRLIVNAFDRRLDMEGRGSKRLPDDQSPAGVAQRAFVIGTMTAFVIVGAVLGGVAVFTVGLAAPARVSTTNVPRLIYVGVVVFVMCIWRLRVWQIRRYFRNYVLRDIGSVNSPDSGSTDNEPGSGR